MTVTVTDGDNPIENATVTIGSDSETTDATGVVEFDLEYGDYEATIEADGYTTATEELAFRSNHKNFTVTLEVAQLTIDVPFTVSNHLQPPVALVGATMTIKATQDGEPLQTVITDEEGKGTFTNISYELPHTTYYVDGISSDETLYNNNMLTNVYGDVELHKYILHP